MVRINIHNETNGSLLRKLQAERAGHDVAAFNRDLKAFIDRWSDRLRYIDADGHCFDGDVRDALFQTRCSLENAQSHVGNLLEQLGFEDVLEVPF